MENSVSNVSDPAFEVPQEPPQSYRLARYVVAPLTTLALLAGCGSGEADSHSEPAATTSASAPMPTPEAGQAAESAPNQALPDSDNEVLAGLGRLEAAAGVRLFDGSMEFIGLPKDKADIGGDENNWHAAALHQIQDAGMSPIVIAEPAPGLDVSELAGSRKDETIKAYYTFLKQSGVTGAALGTYVMMPEVIAGGWDGGLDAEYAAIVNHQAALLHQTFPDAHASTMVDLAPYESDVVVPQLAGIELGSVQSIGVQGFSNDQKIGFSKDAQGKPVANVEAYLNPELIKKISHLTGDSHIWINTGIPETDNGIGKTYSPDQRLAIAQGISRVVASVKESGVTIDFVNLFAENKLDTEEKINFDFDQAAAKTVLPELAAELHAQGVPLYGFTVAE